MTEVNNKRKLRSRKKNANKAKKEKERRLILKADEVLKLLIHGKVSTYKQQQQSKEKIMAADIKECTLKQKFHSNALKFLLRQNVFDKYRKNVVSQMLDKMEATARKSHLQRQKQKMLLSHKKKQKSMILGYFQQEKQAMVLAASPFGVSAPGIPLSANATHVEMTSNKPMKNNSSNDEENSSSIDSDITSSD